MRANADPDSTVYLDYNATAPLGAAARKAWLDACENCWHNPSSPYRPATKARVYLEDARAKIASLMNAQEIARLAFNSGATEGNNTVIHYYAKKIAAGDGLLLISPIEHSSLTAAIATHWRGAIEKLPVDAGGSLIVPALLERLQNPLKPKPTLVSIMAANNETGVLQQWEACAKICREHAIPFHCDASQWIGRLPLRGFADCDWVTASVHKFGGPRGVGLLLCPHGMDDFAMLAGGGQENNQRGGTENVPGILAMLAELQATLAVAPIQAATARDQFENTIAAKLGNCLFLGRDSARLWNTSALILPMRSQLDWLNALERRGILASSGSACAGQRVGQDGSHVPIAMGLSQEQAKRLLRFSSGWQTTVSEWQRAADAVIAIAREWQGQTVAKQNVSTLTSVIEIPD
jgi:cysteine desulfurase